MRSPARRGRTAPAVVAVLASVVLATLVAACGLPSDHAPRAIDRSKVADLSPSTTTDASTVPSPGAPRVTLYFFRENTLEPVARQTNAGDDARALLGLLLKGPTEAERAKGITTFIPPQTQVLGVQLGPDNTLVIDLSKEMDGIGGATSKAAYAQLVFTATSLRTVTRVQFRTEGSPVAVPTDNGNVPTADRASYNAPFVVGGGAGTAPPGSTATPVPQIPGTDEVTPPTR